MIREDVAAYDVGAHTNPNPMDTVMAIGEINLQGNIIHSSWYSALKRPPGTESSKPYLQAIIILAEIIYWYRPKEVREEATGKLLRYEKKFYRDKLQRSYQSFADQFGISKREAQEAIYYLRDKKLISIELRKVKTETGLVLTNVLYIEPVPDTIKAITFSATRITKGQCDRYHIQKGEVSHTEGRGYTPKSETSPSPRETYTETTIETTTKITPEITLKKKNRAVVGKPTDGVDKDPDLYFNTKEFLTIFDSLKRERYPDYKTTTNPKKEAALMAPLLKLYETDKILKALHRFFTDSDTFIVKNGHRVEEFASRFPHFIDDAYWEGQSSSVKRKGGDPEEEEERKDYWSRWSPGQGFFSTSDRDRWDNGPIGQEDKAFLDKGGRFYNPITYCFREWSEEEERWIDTDVVNEKGRARDQREEEQFQEIKHLLPPITFPPKESY